MVGGTFVLLCWGIIHWIYNDVVEIDFRTILVFGHLDTFVCSIYLFCLQSFFFTRLRTSFESSILALHRKTTQPFYIILIMASNVFCLIGWTKNMINFKTNYLYWGIGLSITLFIVCFIAFQFIFKLLKLVVTQRQSIHKTGFSQDTNDQDHDHSSQKKSKDKYGPYTQHVAENTTGVDININNNNTNDNNNIQDSDNDNDNDIPDPIDIELSHSESLDGFGTDTMGNNTVNIKFDNNINKTKINQDGALQTAAKQAQNKKTAGHKQHNSKKQQEQTVSPSPVATTTFGKLTGLYNKLKSPSQETGLPWQFGLVSNKNGNGNGNGNKTRSIIKSHSKRDSSRFNFNSFNSFKGNRNFNINSKRMSKSATTTSSRISRSIKVELTEKQAPLVGIATKQAVLMSWTAFACILAMAWGFAGLRNTQFYWVSIAFAINVASTSTWLSFGFAQKEYNFLCQICQSCCDILCLSIAKRMVAKQHVNDLEIKRKEKQRQKQTRQEEKEKKKNKQKEKEEPKDKKTKENEEKIRNGACTLNNVKTNTKTKAKNGNCKDKDKDKNGSPMYLNGIAIAAADGMHVNDENGNISPQVVASVSPGESRMSNIMIVSVSSPSATSLSNINGDNSDNDIINSTNGKNGKSVVASRSRSVHDSPKTISNYVDLGNPELLGSHSNSSVRRALSLSLKTTSMSDSKNSVRIVCDVNDKNDEMHKNE